MDCTRLSSLLYAAGRRLYVASTLTDTPSDAEARAALKESRQPLVRRFLADGVLPTGEDQAGYRAEKFLSHVQKNLAAAANEGGLFGRGLEDEVVLVLTAIHWALLSRVLSVALQSCRLLVAVASLVQDTNSGGRVGGGPVGFVGEQSHMGRIIWGWLSARVSWQPPPGGPWPRGPRLGLRRILRSVVRDSASQSGLSSREIATRSGT